jgi:hypothetical protein
VRWDADRTTPVVSRERSGNGGACTRRGGPDVPAVAEAARDIGAGWPVYENDEPRDPEAAIPLGADVLSGRV